MNWFKRGVKRFGYNKNVDVLLEEASSKEGLKKTLTWKDLITLGVAGIIGAGIFVLVGEGAATAGVGVAFAFVAAALICAVAGLAYAELSSTIPASGSAYAYLYSAMGEMPGWLVAWALILEYAVGAIAVAVGWRSNALALVDQWLKRGGTDAELLAGQAPSLFECGWWYKLTHSPLEYLEEPAKHMCREVVGGSVVKTQMIGIINVPSILIVIACASLLYFGTKESARVTLVLVLIKVTILLMAIVVGFSLFEMENLTTDPFPLDENGNVLGFAGQVSAVLAAGAIMFFAYIGFDSVSTTAEETKRPKRDLPIGILGSLAITTVLYILAAVALVGAMHYTAFTGPDAPALASEEPFGFVFEEAGIGWAAAAVRIGALIGITSVLLVLILGGVRVFFNMSRDGLLPARISRVHPKRGNPAFTTLLYGAFTLVFAGFLTLGKAVALVNIGTLFAFLMVVCAAWVFRIRRPDVERPFKMPMWSIWNTARGSPILPIMTFLGIAGIMTLIVRLFQESPFTMFAFFAWTGLGLLVYAFYGLRHSREAALRHK